MKFVLLSIVTFVGATTASIAAAQGYQPIVSVPFLDPNTQTVEAYLNAAYWLFIVVGAFLAVIKIIMGGVKWMFSEGITSKTDARKDITGAIFGLLIILSAVLVLNTINTNLTCFSIFDESGNNCRQINEAKDPTGGDPSSPDYVPPDTTGGTIPPGGYVSLGYQVGIMNPNAHEIQARCPSGYGIYIVTTLMAGCFADPNTVNAQEGDTFDPSIYHAPHRVEARERFENSCITNGFTFIDSTGVCEREVATTESCAAEGRVYVASEDACRESLVRTDVRVGDRLDLTGFPDEVVQNALRRYEERCPPGIVSVDSATNIVGCFADPSTVDANPDDVFNPSLYRPSDQSAARTQFESSCRANAHVFVAADASCRASLVIGEVQVGSRLDLTGKAPELAQDARNRYMSGCPGGFFDMPNANFVGCYADPTTAIASLNSVFDPTPYRPSDQNTARTTFENSCVAGGNEFIAASNLCAVLLPGFDFNPAAPLPVGNFCRPFGESLRCNSNITFCGDSTRCVFIASNGTTAGVALQIIENNASVNVIGVGRCGGSGDNRACVGGGDQGNDFNEGQVLIAVQNDDYIGGVNSLISGPGQANTDYENIISQIRDNFLDACSASGNDPDDKDHSVSHTLYPQLTGWLACLPPL